MSGPVYVTSYFQVVPDKKDEVRVFAICTSSHSTRLTELYQVIDGMKQLAAAVEQGEPGCQIYEVFWNEEDGVVAVMQK